MTTIEERLTDLEIYCANQERAVEELNEEVLRQSKILDQLIKQTKILMNSTQESVVKPLSEETRPPHY